jgi:hypothetical protein
MGTGSLSLGYEAGGWWWPPPSSAKFEEKEELCLYSSSEPSRSVVGWTVPCLTALEPCIVQPVAQSVFNLAISSLNKPKINKNQTQLCYMYRSSAFPLQRPLQNYMAGRLTDYRPVCTALVNRLHEQSCISHTGYSFTVKWEIIVHCDVKKRRRRSHYSRSDWMAKWKCRSV